MALPVLGSVAGGGDVPVVGGVDESGGCEGAGKGAGEGAGEGGGEETETLGVTNCGRPGIWVVRRGRPRPTAACPGDAVDEPPFPAPFPTGVLAVDDAAVTEVDLPVE